MLPSVAGIVAREPVKGSWWSHPASHAIYAVLERLDDAEDTLLVKLLSGKQTFVDKTLWRDFFSVVTAKERWQTESLSREDRSLLRRAFYLEQRLRFDAVRLIQTLRNLGPGIIMAATAIGTSHLILSPVAGARFGYELMWLVLFSHVFKYPAFEFGPRFAIATGTSLIRGYQDVPGTKNWAVWAFLVTTILQGLVLLAGMLSVTAAILVASLGTFSLTVWVVLLGVAIVLLHRMGKYPALAVGSKIAMLVLAVISVIAFIAAPPRLSDLAQAFIPSIPTGSLVLVAAILGLMPTGINVAIWHSLWALEQMDDWRKAASDKRDMLRLGLLDLKVGYLLSAVLAVIFVSLGANLLAPRGLTPSGIDVRRRPHPVTDLHRGLGRLDVPRLHARRVRRDVLDRVLGDGQLPADVLHSAAYPLSNERNLETIERPRVLDLHGGDLRVRHRSQLHFSQSCTDDSAHRPREPGGGTDPLRAQLLLCNPTHR